MPLTLALRHSRWSASWGVTLLTALAVIGFIDLGRWQWHRAQQKRALATAFTAGGAATGTLDNRGTAALPRYATLSVQGRYDGAHQFLLDNMSHGGNPGYEVLTPLRLADGRIVIVNRGWVPLTLSRRQLPDIALAAAGEQSTVGRLDELPVAGIALGHVPPASSGPWPRLTSFPTTTDLAAALGQPLQPRQLLLNADEPHGYLRDWHPGGLSPERHLSYALQWWAFAALALGLYVLLNRRQGSR